MKYLTMTNKCGARDISKNPDIPKRGSFGKNAVRAVVLNFLFRMPNRKNAEYRATLEISIASGTIYAILCMICGGLATSAQEIRTSIANAEILHIDETSLSFAGIRIWIWVVLNPLTGETLYLLRPSRGRDVVKEVSGQQLG